MIRLIPVFILFVGLTACAGGGLPPVSERSPDLEKPVFVNGVFRDQGTAVVPASYSVRVGDTLYSIAWRFNRDFKDLARYNSVRAPYIIHPGQRLSLSASDLSSKKTGLRERATAKPKPAKANSSPKISYAETPRKDWRWPASGPTMRGYGKTNAGVDIRVEAGTSVVASAGGEVVYAGSGLRGFEYLIIIKHNEQILSAYGINQNILVREGQVVKVGSRLADFTASGIAQATLHFEIRKNGNHINPQTYIGRGS